MNKREIKWSYRRLTYFGYLFSYFIFCLLLSFSYRSSHCKTFQKNKDLTNAYFHFNVNTSGHGSRIFSIPSCQEICDFLNNINIKITCFILKIYSTNIYRCLLCQTPVELLGKNKTFFKEFMIWWRNQKSISLS